MPKTLRFADSSASALQRAAAEIVTPVQLQRHALVQVVRQAAELLDQRAAFAGINENEFADGAADVEIARIVLAERAFAVVNQPSLLRAPQRAPGGGPAAKRNDERRQGAHVETVFKHTLKGVPREFESA